MTSISSQFGQWKPSANATRIQTLDCHTGGEPLRIITSGFPEIKGRTILEKRRYCKTHFDHLRTSLMFEPRGHADMYGAIVTPAEREDSDFGAIFIHNEGYSSMCGHAVIALTKFAVESGVVQKTGDITQVTIDVPCGQIKAFAHGKSETIESVTFECVPSYAVAIQQTIALAPFGTITFDIAFGGAYYAYVDVSQLGINCDEKHYNELIQYGRLIKATVNKQHQVSHPFEPDLSFLYGTIFIDKSDTPGVHSRNVCVFANGEVDRSPTGSGVSGRIALHHAKQEIALNQPIVIESILGSQFQVEAVRTIEFGGHNAVIPRVTGQAFITGMNEFIIDSNDPLHNGFILR